MQKQILKGGFLTNSLTDSRGNILGVNEDYDVNFYLSTADYYWSEIYVYNKSFTIIRRGELLTNKNPQELDKLHQQSKINLNSNHKVYENEELLEDILLLVKALKEAKNNIISYLRALETKEVIIKFEEKYGNKKI